MAEFKGVNATKIGNTPIDKVDMTDQGGNMRVSYDTYEALIVESGDTIVLGRIPKDAVIRDWTLIFDDLGGTATAGILQVRPIDTAVGAAVSIQAVAVVIGDGAARLKPVVGDINLLPYKALGDSEIILLTSVDDTVAGTIKLETYYTHD